MIYIETEREGVPPFPLPNLEEQTCPPTHIFFSLSKRSKLGEKLYRLKDRATFRPNTASFIEASRKMTSLASNFMPDGRTAVLPRIFFGLAGYSQVIRSPSNDISK